MQVVHERCAGLDVHKRTVVACVLVTAPDGAGTRTVRTFTTMTAGLLALSDWLREWEVLQVAMESTGVSWRPVFNILEDGRAVTLVNAQHLQRVPGRKTDVRDAEWLADLLRHGLLKASFIPDRPQRELRELVRYRRTLIEERSREAQRLHKVRPEDLSANSVLLGTPGQIIDTLRQVEAAGFDEVILYVNVGLKPHPQVRDEMARFMAEVAPGFAD